MKNIQIRASQILRLRAIASKYHNLECVECALAIKNYLIAEGINGKHIKLYTGSATGRNGYIYDDSVTGDAISVNGRHQGISVVINEIEMVFDNHHPGGIPKMQWMANLQFYDRIYDQQEFYVIEEEF